MWLLAGPLTGKFKRSSQGGNQDASGPSAGIMTMSQPVLEMPADTEPIRAGNSVDARPKGAPKTRLLSIEDLDRRTASYRKTAELIDRVEADLGGADRLWTAENNRAARGADRRHA